MTERNRTITATKSGGNAAHRGATAGARWRVGIVGAGGVSPYHLQSLNSMGNVEIVGIADQVRDRAVSVASRFGVKNCFESLDEMIRAVRPDVVHILTPPSTHCSLAIEALAGGCHVFVEKPMAVSEEECERMQRKAEEVGRMLSVDHSARFDPAVLQGLAMARAGRIGSIVGLAYTRSSEYPPYAGGNLPEHYRIGGYPFRDLGVHALAVIEAFLGEIEDLDGSFESSGRQIHLKFDEWRANVKCARGSAQVYLSWNARPMQNQITVYGSDGRLTIDSFLETCTLERNLPGDKLISLMWDGTAVPVMHAARVGLNAVRFAAGRIPRAPDIRRSIADFYGALSAGAALPVSPEEGRRIVRWVERLARVADERHKQSVPKSDLRPADVLVTGATGFLGRSLVESLLRDGVRVRALVRRSRRTLPQHPLLRVVYGDLGEPAAVEAAVNGVATVFHVGATTDGSTEDYECGTIYGTRNVVEAALSHGARLIHVSSLSVLDYTRISEGSVVDERSAVELAPDRRGLYPKTKLEAERIVCEGVKRGLHAVILRPGQIVGPDAAEKPPYGVFALGRRWVVVGSGKMRLPAVYVSDVVDAIRNAAAAEVSPGRIFQIVDDRSITQREYLDAVPSERFGLTIIRVPYSLLYGAALILQIVGRVAHRSVPLTTYRLRALKGHLSFNCAAARRELGWNPRVGITEGVRKTFACGNNSIQVDSQTGQVQRNGTDPDTGESSSHASV